MTQNNPVTIGIVGGIGPESTVEYYKGIINGYRSFSKDDNYPRIIINSINMTEMLSLIDNKDYSGVTDLLLRSVISLKSAGATVAAIASNTPHVVFDRIQALTPIPLISIVEATCNRAVQLKLKNVLLTGTRFTMQHSFYQDVFAQHSINVIVPPAKEQETIHNIIFPELEDGIVVPEKKAEMIAICNQLIENESCDGIILGCTELPLMLSSKDFSIPVLDTAQIHIQSLVERLSGK
jgi:aspartate racemase